MMSTIFAPAQERSADALWDDASLPSFVSNFTSTILSPRIQIFALIWSLANTMLLPVPVAAVSIPYAWPALQITMLSAALVSYVVVRAVAARFVEYWGGERVLHIFSAIVSVVLTHLVTHILAGHLGLVADESLSACVRLICLGIVLADQSMCCVDYALSQQLNWRDMCDHPVSDRHHNARYRLHGTAYPTFLTLADMSVRTDGIVRVEAADHYIYVHLRDQKARLVRHSFTAFCEMVPPELGCIVHRSHWVSAAAVLDPNVEICGAELVLADGDRVAIARKRKTLVRSWIKDVRQKV